MKIPGVYVEIKGDATQLKKEMAQAKEYIASQATGISNALNNALSSGKINTDINKMVQQFGTLNRSMKLDKADFGNVSVDLKGLSSLTGLTEQQFGKLQSRMLQTQAANAQESALRRIATQLKLTEAEVKSLGVQFGLLPSQVERVNKSVGNIGEVGRKKMDLFSGSIAMAAGKFLLLEQAAYSVQRILNATVFGFNSTVETASIGISAAFLNNGQYVDQITGKVLTGQQAMKAAMEDADGVIQQLRASNMVTIATLDQLIKAYQEASPVALSKGFNKDQVEQFTVAMMQAAGAVDTTGMLIGQMGEEMRSLLNGGINPRNTRIATALGITNEDVKKYQDDIQGLFNFLMSKLSAYQAFGDQLQKTWKGVASNTVDIFQQMSAQATEPIFVAVRDGLYEWQQGIAKVVVKTDELGNVTRTLEWNPEYQRSVEQVRGTIEALIGTVRGNRDIIGALFEAGGSAALQSLDGINQVLVLLGNVVTTAKQGVAEIKALAGIKVDIPVPWDIPGAMLNGVRKANMEWTKINDEWSGKRDDSGNLSSGTAQEVAIDRIQQRVKSLKQELSVAENSISSLVFGDRSPEQIKADIAGAESQLKSLAERAKGATGTAVTYQPNKNTAASEEWSAGREKFLESLKTEREKALADYEEQKQYVKTVEEGQRLRAQLSEKLASIDAKAAKSSAAAGLKAERSALKELNAEITGYTAEARAAGNAALDWNRDAKDALEGVQKLNSELGTSGMSDFGKMAYDSAQLVKQGTKDVEAYQLAVSQAGNQITITGAAYDKANAQLNKAKAALAANGAGSDTQDANKVRALEKEVVELDAQLREHTQIYYDLTEAQKSNIKTVEELQAAAKETLAFDTAMAGYQKLGLITSEFYAKLEQQEEQRRKDFVANGGDPWIAEQLKYAANLNDRTALASTEYQQNGSIGGLMGTGLENYKISVDQDAITFYSDLLPDAIGESTDAMAEFFRDIAQGNASLSESWKSLGESVENTVYDILQDLLALQLKMVVLGSLGITGSGDATGGGLVGMISGLFHTGGVVGYEGGARAVSSSLFTGAPRYHAGLQGNEFPAILKKGESVLTEGQMAAVGAGLSASKQNNVTVNIIESPGNGGQQQQRNENGVSIIDVFVEQIKSAVAGDITRGSGSIPAAIASTYGLNRAAGAY